MDSTRKQLIELLEKNNNSYVSGQQLSNQLNISRTAIWKHMKELEKDGYVIEAIPRKGYRIVSFPVKVSENTIQWGLHTKWLGRKVIHKPSVDSTQTIAHRMAMEGAENGTIIIADEQTAGRGRLQRSWHSMKDNGIWMSMILRPEIPPHQAPQITLLAATVLADVISNHTTIKPSIKWPNDIYVNSKKVAGILTEMQAEQDQVQYLVLGIGINVNQTRDLFPEELASIATSLHIESNSQYDIRELIQLLLGTFEKAYETYIEKGFQEIKEKWESYGYKIGEVVTIKTPKKEWQATLVGIKADGALLIRNNDGNIETIYSAEIIWEG